jgi:hypothetical protein
MKKEKSEIKNQEPRQIKRPPHKIVIYTLAMGVTSAVIFVSLLQCLPSTNVKGSESQSETELKEAFVWTTVIIFIAGVLGGCLYNFQGLIKHVAEEYYSETYNISYYLRPISGGVSELVVFFLL